MAAANAFVTTEPDTRYGAADLDVYATAAYAQQFTVGGSGSQEVTVIGCWAADPLDANADIKLAIFTDDAGNGCPGSLVADSEATLANTNGSETQIRHEYGTKPLVTGGAVYWLVVCPGATCYISGETTGGTSVSKAATYPTLPDGDGWHSPTSSTRDYSLYAVYVSGGGGASALPVILGHYRQRRS
jgi:hypothetical protein